MISDGDNHPHDLESRFLTAIIIIILTIFIIIITTFIHYCPQVLDYPIRYELLGYPSCWGQNVVQVFRTPSTAPVQETQDAGCRCIKTAPGHAGALKPLLDQICCNCAAHSGEENLDGEKYLAQVRAWRNIREFNFFCKIISARNIFAKNIFAKNILHRSSKVQHHRIQDFFSKKKPLTTHEGAGNDINILCHINTIKNIAKGTTDPGVDC